LELEKAKEPSSFCLSYFSLTENLNHIAKDVNIFHLKSGGSDKPSYFATFTHSKHTSHHHNQPIASNLFLTWKSMAKILQTIIFDMERF
jgi:hypothetical protein